MIRKILLILSLLVVCGYLTVAFTVLNAKPVGMVCRDVKSIIEDSAQQVFITAADVDSLLKRGGLCPKGKLMDSIVSREIEAFLLKDSRVERVECYKSVNGRLFIDIVQRLPILHILGGNGENYFVDSHGKMMPKGECTAHLPVVTGYVDRKMACKELYQLGLLLMNDELWKAGVQQINVTKERELELVTSVSDHIVFLGQPVDLEQKLRRLKTFYINGLNKVGWNKYSRVNLEFSNQIICTKKRIE